MKIKAFTLIELLIVVAIIAILAAIAVPNFLEAQVRSKVSRVHADMRSLSTALESYFVDANHYPLPYPWESRWGTNIPDQLSTPIAYITSVTGIIDIFTVRAGSINPRWKRYGYICDETINDEYLHRWLQLTPDNLERVGKWRMDSFGPDERSGPEDGPVNYPNEPTYDPTNGTVSRGDIYRNQRDSEGVQL